MVVRLLTSYIGPQVSIEPILNWQRYPVAVASFDYLITLSNHLFFPLFSTAHGLRLFFFFHNAIFNAGPSKVQH